MTCTKLSSYRELKPKCKHSIDTDYNMGGGGGGGLEVNESSDWPAINSGRFQFLQLSHARGTSMVK